eukprot:CAMPEP_0194030402 /NCGR_PEP_ID=MMETSP0009_2-20130614/3901_1 /TAXON_ID=210454 /ORGANISM="Grammatophora oceanica, Strain CCMP 410" /LENGTH=367 /DNA_ID=CAMNT_0038670343 /DNA_START=53 /DNA_END=1156 /DNA_ORIENTATION=-
MVSNSDKLSDRTQQSDGSGSPSPKGKDRKSPRQKNRRTTTAVVEDNEDPAVKAEREYAALIIPYLAQGACHLPGNSWIQDWVQYMTNNHPFLGICCHHRLHPISFRKRLLVLVGSIAAGLAITNFVYLWFLLESEEGIQGTFATIENLNVTLTVGDTLKLGVGDVSVSNYEVFLWTFGAIMHAVFDLSIWSLSACACCLPGGCCQDCESRRYLGSYLVFMVVITTAAAASLAVILRAAIVNDEEADLKEVLGNITNIGGNEMDGEMLEDQVAEDTGASYREAFDLDKIYEPNNFRFLVSFSTELVISLFGYYPILGTIIFSGIFGCGCLPFLGGRPLEIAQEERRQERRRRRLQRRGRGVEVPDDAA